MNDRCKYEHAATKEPAPASKRHKDVVWCVLGLALGPAVALGLARFAYSLLLPAMRTDLGWSYGQAGLMNTANALGYLGGSLLTGLVVHRLGARRSFIAGIAVSGIALLVAAATPIFTIQLVLRLFAGIGSAFTFITGAALVAKLGERSPDRTGLLLTLYTAGGGAGIVISGFTVQPLLGALGVPGWRWSWAALGILTGACLLATLPALRRVLEPDAPAPSAPNPVAALIRPLALPGVAYLLFGAGYIAYVTFVIAYLKGHGFSSIDVAGFWVLLGVATILSGPAWGRLIDRLRSGHALAAMNILLAVATMLVLLVPNTVIGMVSGVVFGSSFLAIPGTTMHIARRRLPPTHWTTAISALTVVFAIGQSIGPGLAGALDDTSGGTTIGLWFATILLAAAALVNFGLEQWSGYS